MSRNKQRTIICATGPISIEDRATVAAHLAWMDAYRADPANRCKCGGMIWRRWSVRNRHDEGAYACKRCKEARPEPQMWKDREAREI